MKSKRNIPLENVAAAILRRAGMDKKSASAIGRKVAAQAMRKGKKKVYHNLAEVAEDCCGFFPQKCCVLKAAGIRQKE